MLLLLLLPKAPAKAAARACVTNNVQADDERASDEQTDDKHTDSAGVAAAGCRVAAAGCRGCVGAVAAAPRPGAAAARMASLSPASRRTVNSVSRAAHQDEQRNGEPVLAAVPVPVQQEQPEQPPQQEGQLATGAAVALAGELPGADSKGPGNKVGPGRCCPTHSAGSGTGRTVELTVVSMTYSQIAGP